MKRRAIELWIRQVALGGVLSRCRPLLFLVAAAWRRLLFRTTFIAITGSVGKTTTKELLAAILASKGRTFRTLGTQNSSLVVALNILRVRPWHRFAVIEIGIQRLATMRRPAQLVKPDVALILGVLRTHTQGFENLDQYADEKAILLESLAPEGLAILNGDDPRVAKMGTKVNRACFIGTSSTCDFWFDRAFSRWPDRLSLRMHWGSESCAIETQYVGVHWAPSIAAALAAAHSLGIPIPEAARVVRQASPYTARMEPVSLPNGAVMIRDDHNGSEDTLDVALRVLREADAVRKVLIITDFSDSGFNRRGRLRHLAPAVSGWLNILVLCGRDHDYGRRKAIEAGMPSDQIHSFETLAQVADFLKRGLQSEDLVLLRGRGVDHVARLFYAQLGTVACWRERCDKKMLCDMCWELGFRPDAAQAQRFPTAPLLR